jgi:hypothetical protein
MSDREAMQAQLDELIAADQAEARQRDLQCEEESRRLALPRDTAEVQAAMRGGQPGGWFDIDNDGFASYEPAGNSQRQQMEQQLERSRRPSAFSRH